MSNATILDVKQAISSATSFVEGVYGKLDGLRLEEVEISEDERFWFITLGFEQPAPKSPLKQTLSPFLPTAEMERVYKLIKVDAKTGEALSMKIRKI